MKRCITFGFAAFMPLAGMVLLAARDSRGQQPTPPAKQVAPRDRDVAPSERQQRGASGVQSAHQLQDFAAQPHAVLRDTHVIAAASRVKTPGILGSAGTIEFLFHTKEEVFVPAIVGDAARGRPIQAG